MLVVSSYNTVVLSHYRIIVSSYYIVSSYIIVSYLICYGILSPYYFVVLWHHPPKALLCYIIIVLSYRVILVVSHYRMIGKEKERRKSMKSKSGTYASLHFARFPFLLRQVAAGQQAGGFILEVFFRSCAVLGRSWIVLGDLGAVLDRLRWSWGGL